MTMQNSTFDTKAFRSALGGFTTGVTIITTEASDGTKIGITANSFNSVSLDPPLVLWSLAKNSKSLPAFQEDSDWAVHILASDQEKLSGQFATSGIDKFSGVELDVSPIDGFRAPLLPGCVARFLCRTKFQYEGGDHIIFVGEVIDFAHASKAPLAFHSGKYAFATQKADVQLSPTGAQENASFNENNLGFLLGRAYFLVYNAIHHEAEKAGFSDEEYFVTSLLTLRERMTFAQLVDVLKVLDSVIEPVILDRLVARHVVSEQVIDGQTYYALTEEGREKVLRVIAMAKSSEADIIGRLGEDNTWMLKNLLKKLILVTDPTPPDLWEKRNVE